ncbi:MAG: ribonuclease HII [Actinomycetales bacterium]|nr:ribonuclease HII [Actinomycetales bacterium]
MSRPPSRRLERELLAADGRLLVAGMDEVGRGALAGPVSVGVVVVDATTGRTPAGLRDSKLLRPPVREALCAPIRRWCVASAVGHTEAEEIDRFGIIVALRLAGNRALAELSARSFVPDVVILDGSHNWLSPAAGEPQGCVPVVTRIKADLTCSVVAAASVLAKCERDALMVARHESHPVYAWADNKGYSAPEHAAALRRHGPTDLHRRSWSLPTAEAMIAEELPLVMKSAGAPPAVSGQGMMDP